MKKLTILLIILITSGLFLILKKDKNNDIKSSIGKILPENKNSQIIFQEDKTNVGQKYISNMYFVKDDTNAKQFVKDFIFSTIELLQKNKKLNEISAVSIVVYKDHENKQETKQYRLLIGSNIISSKEPSFWSLKNYSSIYNFLSEKCPQTSSGNLRNFCFISENME